MKLCLFTLYLFSMSIMSAAFGYVVTVVPTTEDQEYTAGLWWDIINRVLFYVDRTLNEIHRLDTSSCKDSSITLDQMPAFIIPTRDFDERFIIGEGTDVVYLFWPYNSCDSYYAECLIASVDPYCQGNNLNDARADAYGRVFSATYPIPDMHMKYPSYRSTLYRFDTLRPGKACVDAILKPLTFGNDLTWTRDNNIFYFVESDSGCIYSFNYDLVNGNICCSKRVFCLADYDIPGNPDGIVIDWNDDLWITAPGSGLVLNVNPNTGKLMRQVEIPAKYVIDVEFGGDNLDIMYVSTRDVGDPLEPQAGAVFQVTGLDVCGIPNNYAVMNSDCTPEYFRSSAASSQSGPSEIGAAISGGLE